MKKQGVRSAIGGIAKWLEEYHELQDVNLLKFEHPADREKFYQHAEAELKPFLKGES